MMLEADANGDGQITFPEFQSIMNRLRTGQAKIGAQWSLRY